MATKEVSPENQPSETQFTEANDVPFQSGWRFWAVFPGLCLTSILCALDSTILSIALPTIAADLHSSSLFVWIINGYTLTFTAIQPLYGQAADIFGRKKTLLVAIVLFMLGSGICGGANYVGMLIVGRAVQGLGGGGLSILPAMVVSDMVPLRERQKYTGIVYGAFAIGTFIGPVVGGVMVSHLGWRWVFWLNLPIAGLGLGLAMLFVRHSMPASNRESSIWKQLARIDYLGNFMLMGAVTSILIALAGTGSTGPRIDWRSWQTLVPLIVGTLTFPLFIVFEGSSFCKNPLSAPRLFSQRTSALAFFLTFLHGCLLYWASYFIPVFFQAVLQASPQQSGINTLAGAIPMVPFGILGGFIIARTGHYRLNQVIGFALTAIALGCFCTMNQNSATATWVLLQILLAMGAGIVLTALLPAIQAPLPESDVATATAMWGFVQSLGFVWGVSIPSTIFENRFQTLLYHISDAAVHEEFRESGAYEFATKLFISSLSADVRIEVINVFVWSLKLVWEVGTGVAILGLVMSFFIQEVQLRDTLETEYKYRTK